MFRFVRTALAALVISSFVFAPAAASANGGNKPATGQQAKASHGKGKHKKAKPHKKHHGKKHHKHHKAKPHKK